MSMETEGTRQRRRPRKTWWDCGRVDMETFDLSHEDAQDRDLHSSTKIFEIRGGGNRLSQFHLNIGC